MPGHYIVEELQSGIDWLTLTLPRSARHVSAWKRSCLNAIERISAVGYPVELRKLLGYEGVSSGNCFFGEREDGFICQLTGNHANDHFDAVWRDDCNVPRIDLQFTAKFEQMPSNIAKKGYHDATLANSELSSGRRRKLYIIIGSDGGDTLYIGAPSSNQRGRLYNKAVQSELPEHTRSWRYEVVFRNELARNCAGAIPSDAKLRAEYVVAIVSAWYEVRGINTSLFYSGTTPALPLQRALPTDIERKLQWIRTQVAPTIRYLNEIGFRDILLAELFPPADGI